MTCSISQTRKPHSRMLMEMVRLGMMTNLANLTNLEL
jgi:hypothetical protein